VVETVGATEAGPLPPPAVPGNPPPDRFWFSAEYLAWWMKDPRVPVLVTSGSAAGLGILGNTGTNVLYGGGIINEEARSGARFTGGYWIDDCRDCGVEGSVFFLGRRTNPRTFGPDVCPVLARPFLNLNTCMEDAEVANFPGVIRGSITVRTPSDLWGGDVNATLKMCCGETCGHGCYQINGLVGGRVLDLRDAVNIDENIAVAAGLPPALPVFGPLSGDLIQVGDHFAARDVFYGGQLGIDAAMTYGPLAFEFRGKFGVGDTHEILDVNGGQSITTPAGAVSTATGGLLALPSNIGHYHRDQFAFVPEIGVNAGFRCVSWLCVYVGYDFLYWSRVVRASEQIDRTIDVSQIPNFAPGTASTGVARPAVPFSATGFWAQGVTLGLEVTW
jgi:hypothetical protein